DIVASNGYPAFLWMRNQERAQRCQQERENADYLPGYTLHPLLTVTADLKTAVQNASVVFLSVPSGVFRDVARQVAPLLRDDAVVISTSNGIEAEGFHLMSQILAQERAGHPAGVLSGPNFAREIVQKQLTGTVIASEDPAVLKKIPTILSSDTFRVYTNEDVYGVELGGALKNMYAIVAGMAAAIGVGHNSTAMLLTRSL